MRDRNLEFKPTTSVRTPIDDSRAVWERPTLRRLAASRAELDRNLQRPDGTGGHKS